MSGSRVRQPGTAWRSAWALAALVYVLVLAGSPLQHHDISCELKSRTHCTICVSGVSGPGLAQPSEPPIFQLPPAGPLLVTCELPAAALCIRTCNGRSPPTA